MFQLIYSNNILRIVVKKSIFIVQEIDRIKSHEGGTITKKTKYETFLI